MALPARFHPDLNNHVPHVISSAFDCRARPGADAAAKPRERFVSSNRARCALSPFQTDLRLIRFARLPQAEFRNGADSCTDR